MKKTLIVLILVLAYQFTNAQVKVLGRIEPNGATDKYPTHVDSLGRGGLMTAASWQERNAIPVERRKAGMLVRVKSASVDSTYTLGVGLANVDWMPFTAGGSNAWGDLTGNLSDQGDLQAALNAKVSNAISVTYADLTALIASNGLKVNQHYIITDFQTIHTIPNTSVLNTGSIEPLIVMAISTNTLSTEAHSTLYPNDTIWYAVSNSAGSTKGYITRRIDNTRGNDLPNDFRNVKYRRWKLNPIAWVGGTSYAYSNVVQYNNTVYVCLQAHSDTQTPTLDNNPYWGVVIRDNTDYLSYLSTNRTYVNAAGMTITIPVNASDFIDTYTFSNYNNVFSTVIENGSYGALSLPNNVFFTDGQSFSTVRNKFTGLSTNNTASIRGTQYFYDNIFQNTTASIFQGLNTGTASVNFAINGNNLFTVATSIISCNAFSQNTISNRLATSIFSGRTVFNLRATEIRHAFFAGNIRNALANYVGNLVLYNERSLTGVAFNVTSVGAVVNNSTPAFSKFTIDADLSVKTFIANYLTDSATPDAITRAATEGTIYYGLDLSNKANLTGGNTFSGNQFVDGNIGIAIDNAYLINGSTALEASGGYLRLNQGSAFSNGVYTPSAFRVDGGFTSLGTGYFGGNVGIGTSTPTEKLDVNGGRIKVTSDEGVATIKGGEIVLGNLEGNSSQIKMDNTTIVANSAFPIEVGLPSYSGVLALTSQLDGKANLSGGNTFTGANTVLPASNTYGVTVDARNIYDGGGFRYFAGDDADLSNAIEAWGVDYLAPAFEVNRSGAVKLRNYDESKYASLTTDGIVFRDNNGGFTGVIGTSAMWLSSEADVTYQVHIDQPVPHVILQGHGGDDRAKLEMGKLELTKDVDRNVILDAESTIPNIVINNEYIGSAVLATNSLTFNKYGQESVILKQEQLQTEEKSGNYIITIPSTDGLMQVTNAKEVTSSYVVKSTDYTIVVSSNVTVTLPDPSYESTGRMVVISAMSDVVNITCSTSNKISGHSSTFNNILISDYRTYTFQVVQKSGVKYWRVLSAY